MTSYSLLLLLLLLVAILTTTDALPTFVPLQCNSNLDLCSVDNELALSSLVDDSSDEEIVIPCGSCVFADYDDGSTVTFAGGLNVIGSLRFPSEAEVTIRTTHVFVQGLLTMEAPSSTGSYGFRLYEEPGKHSNVFIKPHGENANECDLGSGCKVGRMPIAVVGGRLDIKGLVDSDCFSHVPLLDLDETRQALTVGTEAANCWWNLNGGSALEEDNEIYLTSPDEDMKYGHTAKIVGADIGNGQIFVEEPIPERFQYATFQETSDFYSRVASLKRSILFTAEEQEAEGDVDGETDKFLIGGHIMIFFTPNVVQKLEGVKITNFGQQGNLGRYPVHFHLCRNVDGSEISKNVIMDTNQRCAVIHGSHNVTLYDNVALNTFGHCYVTEDGFEIDNVFERNLGANIKFPTRKLLTSDGKFDSDERGPSVFWIMCPANHWIANVAAGSAHSGFWFETRLDGVRFPSSLIEGAEDFIPSYATVKTFRDNVSHSNSRFGIQYYSPGWKPKGPESVIEGMIVYRNGSVGHFVHGNANFVIKGGIVADNNAVGINHFENFGFRVDGVTVYAYTQNYLNVLNHSSTKFRCKHYQHKEVTGVHIHPFDHPNDRHAQVHYSNLIFRGFDSGCPNAVPIQMNNVHNRAKVDSSPRSFVNTKFEGLGEETLRVSVCTVFSEGVDSIVIHDKDGTIGPMIRPGTEGFLVSDEAKITSFANGDGCFYYSGLGCLRYCQNACLRMIRIEVSNTYVVEDMIMIISDGNQEEEANFKRYNPPRNQNNALSSGYFGAPLPQGNFNLSFVDKVTRKPAWPKYAKFVFQDPPECSGYADATSVTFTKPSFDVDRCSQLIEDGDLENLPDQYGEMGQWQTEFSYEMQLNLVSPGYGGSGAAIKAYHKTGDTCNNGSCTLGQWLDSSCFAKWVHYDLSAKVRILDRDGNDTICEETDTNCGVAWIDIRYDDNTKSDVSYVIGSISNTDQTLNGWYHMKGQFVIDQDVFEVPDQAMLKWVISKDIEYIVDEVSLTATKIDPTVYPSGQPSISSQPSVSLYPTFVAENLALLKPTFQTSTLSPSDLAVDGNKNTMSLTKNGCHYWEVDLEYPAIITEIKIFFKYSYSPGRLSIDVLNPKDELVESKDWDKQVDPEDFEFTLRSVVGQKVRIQAKSGFCYYLQLREVEVYGKYLGPTTSPTTRPSALSPSPSTIPTLQPSRVHSVKPSLSTMPSSSSPPSISSYPTVIGENLALGKPTWQKNTLKSNESDLAVDGDLSTKSHTKNGCNEWKVDLEYPAVIRKVKVVMYVDLVKLWIDVLDADDELVERKVFYDEDKPEEFEFNFGSVVGQKVRLLQDSTPPWTYCNYLAMKEVEVYGKYLDTPTQSPTSFSTTKLPTTLSPTTGQTNSPTSSPTVSPTKKTDSPTVAPTNSPTIAPTNSPTVAPTNSPTVAPTNAPTVTPINSPTVAPTNSPTVAPTNSPTAAPTKPPTESPTTFPSNTPTVSPDNCVDGDGKFFYKMKRKNTKPITKICSWLSKNKNKNKICSKNVDYYNDFVPPQDLCQQACASCGACFENRNSKYVHSVKKKSGKVTLKTCGWLAALSTKKKKNFCKKKKLVSGGYDKPKITCPVTCLVGDCKA